MSEMTMRQRMLAVIRGQPHDRVPFVSYRGMAPWEDAWKLIGRNNLGMLAWTPACDSQTPNCHREVEQAQLDGKTARRTTLHTPAGKLTDLWEADALAKAYLLSHDNHVVSHSLIVQRAGAGSRAAFSRADGGASHPTNHRARTRNGAGFP